MADETAAEKEKLEAARKDAEKDLGEDPVETTEGKPRKDAKRKDGQDEEIPAWADSVKKAGCHHVPSGCSGEEG